MFCTADSSSNVCNCICGQISLNDLCKLLLLFMVRLLCTLIVLLDTVSSCGQVTVNTELFYNSDEKWYDFVVIGFMCCAINEYFEWFVHLLQLVCGAV